MKEGKLSSALVERYHLKESVGRILWHSLDKNGNIGEYDMQVGTTVIRGVLPEQVEPIVIQEHSHSTRKRKRKKKK